MTDLIATDRDHLCILVFLIHFVANIFNIFSAQSSAPYDYLLSMFASNFTKQKQEELAEQKLKKEDELVILNSKTAKELWQADVDELGHQLDIHDEQEKKTKDTIEAEYLPSENGILVEVKIDSLVETIVAEKRKQKDQLKKEIARMHVGIVVRSNELTDAEIKETLGQIHAKKVSASSMAKENEYNSYLSEFIIEV